jgi:cytochrome P450
VLHIHAGYVFRKGSYVWASTVSVQFNPDYYPNPREFDPSRFEVCVTCNVVVHVTVLKSKLIHLLLCFALDA